MKSCLNHKNFFVVVLCASVLGFGAEVANCRTINVRADGTGDYPTIQEAIDAANPNDEIVLEQGTYTGDGNRDIDFLGKVITLRSTDPNDPNIVATTIIDCQGFEMYRHRGFNFVSGEDGNSVLAGLTITGGYAPVEEFTDEYDTFRISIGGAIFCYLSSPSIRRCRIIGNRAEGLAGGGVPPWWGFPPSTSSGAGGGGIGCRESEANISNCIISDNSAISGEYTEYTSSVGGGIYSSGEGGVISNCTISNNTVTGDWAWGGGVSASNCTITNCIVSGNLSNGDGGGISAGNCTISHCTVTENSARGGWGARGGGINAGNCIIDGCVIGNNALVGATAVPDPWWGYCPNGSSASGGGVYLFRGPDGEATIENCIVYGNTATGGAGGVSGTGVPPSGDGTDGGNGYGGGIFYSGCEYESVIENCIVLDNSVSGGAGGSWHGPWWPWPLPEPWPGTPGNPGNGYGAGICTNSENMLIRHCIVRGGEADYGQEIAAVKCSDNPSYVTVCYCDIGGLESSTYAADDCTVDWGLGNIDVEPMLTLDSHLRADSPCIDAGDPNYSPGPEETDIDGEQRGYDGIVDIGIDEFIDSDGDGLPDFWEQRYFGSPTAAEPGDDPDGDGFDNLKEYHISSDPLVPGANYYIDPNEGDDAWDGLAPVWDGTHGPKATIQAAIDVAEDADKIILAAGIYTGDGNRDIDFLGKIITVRSTDPNDPNIVAATVIDCEATPYDRHRGFNFHYGEGPNSVLSGVTITNGWAPKYEFGGAILCDASSPTITNCIITDNTAFFGGGIHCRDSSPVITRCRIGSTTGRYGSGVGIYCEHSSPTIVNCTISGNMGSGILCEAESSPDITSCTISDNNGSGIGSGWEANPTISDCRISGNTTSNRGGGISCGDATITNCIITGNLAEAEDGGPGGGGIYCWDNRNQVITNCIITGNRSRRYGGGICGWWGGTKATISNCIIKGNVSGDGEYAGVGGGVANCEGPITNCIIVGNRAEGWNGLGGGLYGCSGPITNCTIAENRAGERGGGLSDCEGEITNCIIWGNRPEQIYDSASVTYSNVQGGWEGEGNIDADPLFALTTDYHLMPGSPCIDAGTNDPCGGLPATDKDGVARPLDGDGDANAVADMGAYEYAPNSPSIAVSALSFYFIQDWPKPDPQRLQIRNCGGRPLQWEIVEDCSWLEVAPANGVSTDQINEVAITVEPNGLMPGFYGCTFNVQDPNASNSPVTIRVTMPVGTVLRVPSPNCPTIQAAIDAAGNFDVVLVADGNYTGTGNKNLNFRGKPITVCSENGPNNCTIDCENSGRGFHFQNGEKENSVVDGFTITNGRYGGISCWQSSPTINNCTITGGNRGSGIFCRQSTLNISNCIITGNSPDHDGGGIGCELSSLTITNCTINGNNGGGIYGWRNSSLEISNCTISGNNGGGIRCEDGGSLTISNCTISGNNGGGIYCWGGSLTITNSTISNNTGGWAGGICCYGDSWTITNCTISDNSAEEVIGGVYCANYFGSSGSSSTITNCIISGNTALKNYGGIYVSSKEDDNPTITNCIITGNSAGEGYAGLVCWGGNPTITNCTITGNTADEYAGGIFFYESSATITNCILWGNEAPDGPQIYLGHDSNASVSYTDVQGGQADVYVEPGSVLNWGAWNLQLNPCFVNPNASDYHLSEDSPCINAGDPNYVAEPKEADLDGMPRIIGGRVDMGAYEYRPPTPAELAAELLEGVGGLELPRGIANSLLAKLDTALQKLEDANEKNDIAAINSLQAFINAIEAQRGKKIPETDADALIAAALDIIELLSTE